MQHIGRYPVTGLIGSGGFGTVYLGTHPDTGQPVAIKVLDWPDEDWRRQMFRDEARALLAINHPNVVRALDVIDQPGLAALITEYVDGASLRTVLDSTEQLTGPQALAVLTGALDGLAAVHAQGLVHADLKPDNILLDTTGTSRLIDFGLTAPARPLNGPDSWIGTPAYLAPEVVLGTHIDHRSDIYAAAVILFELLTGRQPYKGPNAVMTALLHVQSDVPDPRRLEPTISDLLAGLTMQDLAKDPLDRHQNTPAFARSLTLAAEEAFGPDWRTRAAAGTGAATGTLTALVTAALATAPAGAGLLGAPPLAAAGFTAGAIATTGAVATTSVVATTGGSVAGATAGTSSGIAGATAGTTALGGGKAAAAIAGTVAVVAAGAGAATLLFNDDDEASRPAGPLAPVALVAEWDEEIHVVRADGTVAGTLPLVAVANGRAVSADGAWVVGADQGAINEPKDDHLTLLSTADAKSSTTDCLACDDPFFAADGTLWTDAGTAFRTFSVGKDGLRELETQEYPVSVWAAMDDCGASELRLVSVVDGWAYVTWDCQVAQTHVLVDPATGDTVDLVPPSVQGGLSDVAVSADGRYVAGHVAFDGQAGSGVTVLDLVGSRAARAAVGAALAGPSGSSGADQATGQWFVGTELRTTWDVAATPNDTPTSGDVLGLEVAGLALPTTPDIGEPGSAQAPLSAGWQTVSPAGVTWVSSLADGTVAQVVDGDLWLGDPDAGGTDVASDVLWAHVVDLPEVAAPVAAEVTTAIAGNFDITELSTVWDDVVEPAWDPVSRASVDAFTLPEVCGQAVWPPLAVESLHVSGGQAETDFPIWQQDRSLFTFASVEEAGAVLDGLRTAVRSCSVDGDYRWLERQAPVGDDSFTVTYESSDPVATGDTSRLDVQVTRVGSAIFAVADRWENGVGAGDPTAGALLGVTEALLPHLCVYSTDGC